MGYLANKLKDENNLGWFTTPADLAAAYPVGANGYFAMVGSTDTIWTWDSDTSSWVNTGATGSGDISGSGTANELAYFTAEKTIDNLAVITYPSLAEVSYVKGVTSAIQTQLNGKAPSLTADDNYVTDAEKVVIGNTSGTNTGDQTVPVKASGIEIDTGTDDAKFATAKALADSNYEKNPMTTAGDIIYGETSGVPTRLAKGTAAQVLTMNASATAPEWAVGGGGGGGDVIGPALATDNAVARFDSTTGKLIQNSALIIDDYGAIKQTGLGNSVFIGDGAGNSDNHLNNYNVGIGYESLYYNTAGYYNTANGMQSLNSNTTGNHNTANGMQSLLSNTTGTSNTANGHSSLFSNATGNDNTANGYASLNYNTTGNQNTALGYQSGSYIANGTTGRTTGDNGLYLGYNSKASADGTDNEIVIGYNAIGNGSNTATLGNTSIVDTYLRGAVHFHGVFKMPTTDGTSGQVLKTDGAGSLTWQSGGEVVATGAEVDTGTDNNKMVTPKAITDSKVSFIDGTETLTNKRINPRLVTAASYTTNTGTSLDVSTCDQFEITAQAGALLFNAPGGTPLGGQKLIIRIKDNGTARALTYNAIFRAMGNVLPLTTVVNKTLYMGFIFNNIDTKWDLVATAQEA